MRKQTTEYEEGDHMEIPYDTYKAVLMELMKFKTTSPVVNYTARECLMNILDLMDIKVGEYERK